MLQWSFLGEPQLPRRLVTTGPYALLRHPIALGNILFLVGFSLAGGALAAAATFVVAFYIYQKTVIPQEEAMLGAAFGEKYLHYKEQVPAFSWALILLLVIEALLIWRYAPFSLPVGGWPPRPSPSA
jgi:protein-S-isoprenylcysteine O-methyltransferase Ste14